MITELITQEKKQRNSNVRTEGKRQFRCQKCNKLLAEENGKGRIAGLIKCPRCGYMNEK
ncbi:MAG: Com family DNA-binding transcriptional regulator [Nitrospirota bacterium]